MKKKILSLILFSLIFVLSTMNSVMALEQDKLENKVDELTAYKETVKTENKVGEYDVHISVPGKDGIEQHNEVILMVDGSYSMDEEWEDMKAAIIEIGKSFLNGTGNIQLTLMAFGMGDNEVLTHIKSVSELEKSLGELPGTLLYGRSSTNCEAGFTGVIEYIQNHDNTLNDVYVIYISDGNINTDETPHVFYNWKENSWLRKTPEVLASWSLSVELEHISMGGNPSVPFKTIFGENIDVQEILNNVTEEQTMAWIDLVWDAVYENAGFDKEAAYAVSDAERAFVDYDNKYGTHIQEAFYYALWGRSYPNRWERTTNAAKELTSMEEVISLYLVDYDSYSSWMDTGINAENKEFIQSNGISGLIDALDVVVSDLSKTSYNNVVISDYTSKWVNPIDQNNDGIFDELDITVIYNGEIIENPNIKVINLTTLTEEELLEMSLSEQLEIKELLSNNIDVFGNKSGSIYKIKWIVKEGMLKASDRFTLSYKVKVDNNEEGFVSNGVDYIANALVNITYDKNETVDGETETNNEQGIVIKKDPVIQKENIIVITKTDESGNLLAGADFEISSEFNHNLNILKEYSTDGINWSLENSDYSATYFRFSGLYDYKYILKEVKTPKWYIGMEDIEYDFTNLEGQYIEHTVKNTAIKGEVIIHYVVKVSDEYIPLNEFAYDEEGNLLSGFENINLEDVIISDKIEVEFKTFYENIESLTLNGLYIGNLITNKEYLNKLENNVFIGTFKEGIQEFTYVYEFNIGNGNENEEILPPELENKDDIPLPPQTGYDNYNILGYFILIYLFLLIKKIFV